MKPKLQLHERLLALYDKYEDDEVARCVIQAVDIDNELKRTRFDRIREWAFVVLLSIDIIHALLVALGWKL